jgi:hypothetical protein
MDTSVQITLDQLLQEQRKTNQLLMAIAAAASEEIKLLDVLPPQDADRQVSEQADQCKS